MPISPFALIAYGGNLFFKSALLNSECIFVLVDSFNISTIKNEGSNRRLKSLEIDATYVLGFT